jgi:hypothetical protein
LTQDNDEKNMSANSSEKQNEAVKKSNTTDTVQLDYSAEPQKEETHPEVKTRVTKQKLQPL